MAGLNSPQMLPPDYIVDHGRPWTTGAVPPATPDGYVPLATFNLAATIHPGLSWFVVFGRPGSAIARSGANEDAVDGRRLDNERLISAWIAHRASRETR